MTTSLPSRALALAAAFATLAVTFVALPATPLAPAATASADNPTCTTPIADYPNVHGQIYGVPWGFYGVDPQVGVYIAGDWDVIGGAAEAEGTIVVGGNATFDSADYFNLGTVGLGSQVNAGAFTDMLTTGGDISVLSTTTLDVGNHRGGDIVAGGTITPSLPSVKYELNGGTATEGAVAPLAPYASVPTYYQGLSASFAALPTGTTTVDLLTDPSQVTFIGDGVSTRQVFSVSGSALGTDASQKGIEFTNIPTGAVIVVNVTGATAEMSSWGFSMNGSPLLFSAAEPDRVFSNWTQSIAWNFPTATDVSLGLNGQLPGSVLIPSAASSLDLRTTINGRLYVNGDVTFGGANTTGLEIHNYPLRSDCAATDGTFTVAKTVSDPDSVTDDTRVYTGTYECVDALGDPIESGTWSLEAGDSLTVTALPAGTICTAEEDASTLTADPSATDPTYSWAAPTYSDDEVTVVADDDVSITITNVVLHDVGSLSITKALTDADNVVSATREFEGGYSCSDSTPAIVASGTWALTAGGSVTIDDIPAGAVCSISEDVATLTAGPSASDPSYTWGTPTYSSTGVTIATSATVGLTVTNVVERHYGSLEITKSLDDPDSVVPGTRSYTGTWSCSDDDDVLLMDGTWSMQAGAAPYVVDFIPTGAVCVVEEDDLTVAPSSTDSSYYWDAATYSDTDVSILEDDSIGIEVQNAVLRGLGDFEMVKVLDDPYDVVDLSRVYTGTWGCTFNSATIESGTWSTTAGAPALTLATDLPAGTVCTLAEDAATLAAPPLAGFPQYVWLAPVITPATVTILDGGLHRITVTNIVYDPIGDIGGLAHAGTDSIVWIVLGSGVAAGGILLVYFARRRRLA